MDAIAVLVAVLGRAGLGRSSRMRLRRAAAHQVHGRVQGQSDRRVQEHGDGEDVEQQAAHRADDFRVGAFRQAADDPTAAVSGSS